MMLSGSEIEAAALPEGVILFSKNQLGGESLGRVSGPGTNQAVHRVQPRSLLGRVLKLAFKY